jgi:hypothetical protein
VGLLKRSNLYNEHRYSLIAFFAILIFLFYPNIGIYDWVKEVLYCDFIKLSILNHKVFPMFMWNNGLLAGYPAVDQSAFFVSNPETMLFSPFIPLLLILPSAMFLKLLVLIHFLIGWAGIQVLSKTCGWQARRARIFSALFLLSPIIIQHVAIGYLPWINLYFFPWLLYFLLQDNFHKKWLGSGIMLALMLLQGGLHVFVWSGIFIAFFGFFRAIFQKDAKSLLSILLSGLSACLLALPRILTSFQSFSTFGQKFFSGYSSRAFLKWALIPPFFTPPTMDDIEFFIEEYIDGVPYWDGNLFWGFLLICAIVLPFVIRLSSKNKDKNETADRILDILALAASSALILLLSFGDLYQKGISFISDMIHLPALKGMEKYPYRFAIPAYFGFSFIIAWYWKNFLDFFTRALNQIRKLALVIWGGFFRFSAALRLYQKIFTWISGILVCLCLAFLALKSSTLRWVNSQIALAYAGQGAKFLADMMEHAGTIPPAYYFTKAETLLSILNRILVFLTVISVSLWLLGVTYKPGSQRAKKPILREFNVSPWLPEALVVLPLLLAFGMWWRVSLATPQELFPEFIMQAPIVSWVGGNGILETSDIKYSPLLLKLDASEVMTGKTLVFSHVPIQDTRYLELETENAVFVESNGKAALKITQAGPISIQVKNLPVVFSAVASIVGWAFSGWIMLRLGKKKNL